MWLFFEQSMCSVKVSSLSLGCEVHYIAVRSYWLCYLALYILTYFLSASSVFYWGWEIKVSCYLYVFVCVTLHLLSFLFYNSSCVCFVLYVVTVIIVSLLIMAFSIKRCPSLSHKTFFTWVLYFLCSGLFPLHHLHL